MFQPHTVNFNDSVTQIKNRRFAYSDCQAVQMPPKINFVGEEAFIGCRDLCHLTIGDGVAVIEKRAFCGCTSLTQLVIPPNVVELGAEAFSGCTSLRYVCIFAPLRTLPDGVFKDCENLCKIILPETLVRIGYQAFAGCKKLSSIKLPDSVFEINPDAFNRSTKIIARCEPAQSQAAAPQSETPDMQIPACLRNSSGISRQPSLMGGQQPSAGESYARRNTPFGAYPQGGGEARVFPQGGNGISLDGTGRGTANSGGQRPLYGSETSAWQSVNINTFARSGERDSRGVGFGGTNRTNSAGDSRQNYPLMGGRAPLRGDDSRSQQGEVVFSFSQGGGEPRVLSQSGNGISLEGAGRGTANGGESSAWQSVNINTFSRNGERDSRGAGFGGTNRASDTSNLRQNYPPMGGRAPLRGDDSRGQQGEIVFNFSQGGGEARVFSQGGNGISLGGAGRGTVNSGGQRPLYGGGTSAWQSVNISTFSRNGERDSRGAGLGGTNRANGAGDSQQNYPLMSGRAPLRGGDSRAQQGEVVFSFSQGGEEARVVSQSGNGISLGGAGRGSANGGGQRPLYGGETSAWRNANGGAFARNDGSETRDYPKASGGISFAGEGLRAQAKPLAPLQLDEEAMEIPACLRNK